MCSAVVECVRSRRRSSGSCRRRASGGLRARTRPRSATPRWSRREPANHLGAPADFDEPALQEVRGPHLLAALRRPAEMCDERVEAAPYHCHRSRIRWSDSRRCPPPASVGPRRTRRPSHHFYRYTRGGGWLRVDRDGKWDRCGDSDTRAPTSKGIHRPASTTTSGPEVEGVASAASPGFARARATRVGAYVTECDEGGLPPVPG